MKNLHRFFSSDAAGGIILIIAAALAMLLANTGATSGIYHAFLETPVQLRVGALEINKNMLLWINDALMAIFFLLIGLEVKRELIQGSLASRRQAVFPVIAALGGMVVPALVYLAFNAQDPVAREGWAIPAATDIAFALGVLALLGSRIPAALKIFLMALAIIDDLGAIVIIALFYTNDLSLLSLGVAAAAIVVLIGLNLCGVRRTGIYILVGAILWTAVLKSGVHATLAGVIVGFLIPLKEKEGKSPAKQLEHVLHPWVAFLILPLFAFANAGVSLGGVTLEGLTSLLPLGIIAGLFIGKPLGISLFCWLALKLKWAHLPEGTTCKQIMAVGVLCGIGFTMSIFIASLAFGNVDPALINWAKLGILIGSVLSAVVGYTLLRMQMRGSQDSTE
ncbi:MAG: Na+/H+ antiporter NhaA [Yokenella regensburgei]|jgi:NhaA family Na+:H+ antiporter|uniref:Na(+)/H(+) antiporter NhaA n=1 Tax=Yokenella regensburgei TaxID=158877 RepID=A0ABX9RXT2_9ENTR|nr:Na+/H+ antiporter NhaA [Yokenella regensburgei]EHM51170.1 Na+/H+ antiporter NhaA [Yokenella regensburgei ATCC 43003]KAF1368162.1 NhaA family Na+:H+ antiporter [Yokenella regensburgei]MDQ4429351.1 Na+/H+ antiporter NhaA [Yokenella regensburgei]MDR3104554.1 Na+/H+ antiporter NhaA [Yokenella regensburgei]QIU91669.1 Na+/H+ antiporter NhaA [Yokenella regensburgei]